MPATVLLRTVGVTWNWEAIFAQPPCPLWLILPNVLHPAVGLVVDLLCFCIVSHSYRIKYYILRNNVVEKVGGRGQAEGVENCGLAAPSTFVY